MNASGVRRGSLALATVLSLNPLFSAAHASPATEGREADRAHAVAANCTMPFFPDFEAEPLQVPGYSGAIMVHRPLAVSVLDPRYSSQPRMDLGLGAREEMWEDEEVAYTSLVIPNGALNCTRIMLRVNPRQLGIQTHSASVPNTLGVRPDGPVLNKLTFPAMEAQEGEATVLVYVGGKPSPNHPVKIWANPWALPGSMGMTVGHEHVIRERQDPTLKINGKLHKRSNALVLQTDAKGEASVKIKGQYRGGVEAVGASAKLIDKDYEVARSVVLTVFPRLVYWPQLFAASRGTKGIPKAQPDFPFVLVGSEAGFHSYNHFVSKDAAYSIAAALTAVWQNDPARQRATQRGEKRWIILNDISLEYGGMFKLQDNATCNGTSNSGGHVTHNVGLDFDVVPCYTWANGNSIGSTDCYNRSGGSLRIDEAVLAAYVVGGRRGVVLKHGHSPKKEFFHYHIRFNRPK